MKKDRGRYEKMSAGPPGRQSLNGSQRCLLPVFMPLCNSLHLNGAGHTDLLLKNRIGKGDKIAHWDSAIKDGDLYLAHFLSLILLSHFATSCAALWRDSHGK